MHENIHKGGTPISFQLRCYLHFISPQYVIKQHYLNLLISANFEALLSYSTLILCSHAKIRNMQQNSLIFHTQKLGILTTLSWIETNVIYLYRVLLGPLQTVRARASAGFLYSEEMLMLFIYSLLRYRQRFFACHMITSTLGTRWCGSMHATCTNSRACAELNNL